jgi:hypothetical protein
MKIVRCIIIVTSMTFVLPAKPQKRSGSASRLRSPSGRGHLAPLYLVTGVRGSGTDNTGPPKSFICTVSSGAVETINIKVFNSGGMQLIDRKYKSR